MSRKLTKKEEKIYEMLNKSFVPFKEKYQDIQGVFWELGGLFKEDGEDVFSMGTSIWVNDFDKKLSKKDKKYSNEILEDNLIVECFTNFMNELNNSGVLSKVKLKKSDKLQLDYLNCDSPYLDEYIVYIGNDKKPLQSIELNR
jgi:hypothetical protein